MIRTILCIVLALSFPLAAAAQEPKTDTSTTVKLKLPAAEKLAAMSRERPGEAMRSAQPSFQKRRHSVGRKVVGATLGAVGGLFAGGYLGAMIEGDGCGCDDPGLKGALIGAPIGLVAGGILGAIIF
jgi:hypothetical protein